MTSIFCKCICGHKQHWTDVLCGKHDISVDLYFEMHSGRAYTVPTYSTYSTCRQRIDQMKPDIFTSCHLTNVTLCDSMWLCLGKPSLKSTATCYKKLCKLLWLMIKITAQCKNDFGSNNEYTFFSIPVLIDWSCLWSHYVSWENSL